MTGITNLGIYILVEILQNRQNNFKKITKTLGDKKYRTRTQTKTDQESYQTNLSEKCLRLLSCTASTQQ
jgi:hypothetical protein